MATSDTRGIVRFLPFKRFGGEFGRAREWAPVLEAVPRAEGFVIETSTAVFAATLRFYPGRPDSGDYEIHRRGRVAANAMEKGRTESVEVVTNDNRLPELMWFPTRYAIVTVGSEWPHSCLIWHVGLTISYCRRTEQALDPFDSPSASRRLAHGRPSDSLFALRRLAHGRPAPLSPPAWQTTTVGVRDVPAAWMA